MTNKPTSEAGKQAEGWEKRLDDETWARNGDRVVISRDRLDDFIKNLLETAKKEAIEENEIDITKRMEQVAKDVREEVVELTKQAMYKYNHKCEPLHEIDVKLFEKIVSKLKEKKT